MTSLQQKVDRLEELRRKIAACDSIEDASDLLAEFDRTLKDLIDEVSHEADAQS